MLTICVVLEISSRVGEGTEVSMGRRAGKTSGIDVGCQMPAGEPTVEVDTGGSLLMND